MARTENASAAGWNVDCGKVKRLVQGCQPTQL
jgi:hypothetical protein